MSAQHTPLSVLRYRDSAHVLDANNHVVAHHTKPDDAARIVQCVNTHGELVEALEHAVHWFDQLKKEDADRYKAVIAKATGSAP
jgi:(2Fe-2S) ferredoxin